MAEDIIIYRDTWMQKVIEELDMEYYEIKKLRQQVKKEYISAAGVPKMRMEELLKRLRKLEDSLQKTKEAMEQSRQNWQSTDRKIQKKYEEALAEWVWEENEGERITAGDLIINSLSVFSALLWKRGKTQGDKKCPI